MQDLFSNGVREHHLWLGRQACKFAAACARLTALLIVLPWVAPDQVDPGALPLVSCAPLGFVLERLALRRIHFWSLDVEGAELEVLRTVDFSQVCRDLCVGLVGSG